MSIGAAMGVSAGLGLVSSAMGSRSQSRAAKSQENAQKYATQQAIAAAQRAEASGGALYDEAYRLSVDQANQNRDAGFVDVNALLSRNQRSVWDEYGANADEVRRARDQNISGVTGAGDAAIYDLNTARDHSVRRYDAADAVARGQFDPYATAGRNALADLQAGRFEADPGYRFRMRQGQDAIEASRAASGGLFSGATGKALQEYGQDYAANEWGNWWNRKLGLVDRGMDASGAIAGSAASTAGNVSGVLQNTARDVGGIRMETAGKVADYRSAATNSLTSLLANAHGLSRGYDSAATSANIGLRGVASDAITNAAWNRATGRSGLGMGVAQAATGAWGQYGSGMSNAYANQGNAAAAGWTGAAQAINGGLNNYVGYNMYQNALRQPQPVARGSVSSGLW